VGRTGIRTVTLSVGCGRYVVKFVVCRTGTGRVAVIIGFGCYVM